MGYLRWTLLSVSEEGVEWGYWGGGGGVVWRLCSDALLWVLITKGSLQKLVNKL